MRVLVDKTGIANDMGDQMQFHILPRRETVQHGKHRPAIIRPQSELIVLRVASVPKQARHIDSHLDFVTAEHLSRVRQEKCRIDRALDGCAGGQFSRAIETHAIASENPVRPGH